MWSKKHFCGFGATYCPKHSRVGLRNVLEKSCEYYFFDRQMFEIRLTTSIFYAFTKSLPEC